MISFQVDVGKNRLVVTLTGAPTQAEFDVAFEESRAQVKRLRAPFDVLHDAAQLESIEALQVDRVMSAMKEFFALGVRRLVLVAGKSRHGAVAFEKVSRHAGHAAHLAFSRAEAESVLDGR